MGDGTDSFIRMMSKKKKKKENDGTEQETR